MQSHHVVDLRCEYAVDPLGLGAQRPRLSWRLESGRRGAAQSGYQIVVAGDADPLAAAALLWDSGRVESPATCHVAYAGPPLASGRRCVWRVRSWDERGAASAWSEPACWEMGLLDAADWRAHWISPAFDAHITSDTPPVPYLRRAFMLERPVRAARLYITSQGLFEAHLNGQRVGDCFFTPGWTSYHKRTLVATFDVTALLHGGENVLGAMLGEGWYRGRIGAIGGRRNAYGSRLALLAQLHVTHSDGTVTILGSDGDWQASAGPILSSGLYDGEHIDARLHEAGWCSPGFDASHWGRVEILDAPKNHLGAVPGPWVRRMQELPPVASTLRADGARIYDLGQNMTGWVRLRVQGARGTKVVLRHAEVLEADGSLHTANLRSAQQMDSYILSGEGMEEFEPHFTFHGFRYVEVSCIESGAAPVWPADLEITGIVAHSDLERAGTFACSDARLNRLQQNIVWGQRGNFVDIPTDCPQRDERLGWSGDAQVFARTACFNLDSALFLTKWLRDLYADQHPEGAFPIAAPLPRTVIEELSPPPGTALPFYVEPGYGAAGYADAGVIVPWVLYQQYGDRRILEECYAGMARWADGVQRKIDDDLIVDGWFQFGDWLAPHAPTVPDLAATAYFAYSTRLLGQIAGLLGRKADRIRFETLSNAVRAAFCNRFVHADGHMEPATQSAYVLALAFDLLPQEQRAAAAALLVADIRARNNHLSTGFLSTPHLCRVLADAGYLDVAYDLLLQETYPSWLYPLAFDATTIWERWNGIEPDGALFHPAMNSFNHYAYGAIGEFLYSTVAGLDLAPGSAGFERFRIRPRPGGGLSQAAVSLKTLHGVADVSWQIRGDRFLLDVTVPPNTSATVILPTGDDAEQAREGETAVRESAGITQVEQGEDGLQIEIAAGAYRFDVSYRPPAALPAPPPNPQFRYPRVSIFTSVGGILDHEAALRSVAQNVANMETLVAAMRRRRMYSLHQLALFVPDVLTSDVLEDIDRALTQLN